LKQILTRVEKFNKSIDQIPNFSISIDCVMLNMLSFKQKISNMPAIVLNNLNEIMIKFLQTESQVLYQELMEYIQIFSSETSELTQYIEQSNAYRKIIKEYGIIEKKVENLESVALFFDTDVLSQIQTNNYASPRSNEIFKSKSVVISETISEVRKCYDLLPQCFLEVKHNLDLGRENLAIKVIETSKALLQMTNNFEEAYIENFHRRASTKKPKEILANVQSKSKTLEEIQKKSNLFKQSLEFLKSEGDRRVMELYPDLDQFECHVLINKIRRMHEDTLQTWEYISIWQDRMESIHQSNIAIIGNIYPITIFRFCSKYDH
jgi:hypothetical protein